MKLITEIVEQVNVISEANDAGGKEYFIEGIFLQAMKENKNKRIYPENVMDREVNRYVEQYINKNRAYGELGHPQGPTINLERVSHMIKSLTKDGYNYIGKAKIMDTPYGNIVKNLMLEGAGLGVSSRGMGSLKPNKNGVHEVQDDFYLATAADIVADPSAPDAFVRGIMEGKEWVWDNGIIKEVEVSEMKETIVKAPKRMLDEEKIRVFQQFISKLS